MPAKRTIDPVDLLQWERDGLKNATAARTASKLASNLCGYGCGKRTGRRQGTRPSQRLYGSPAQPHDGNSRLRPRSVLEELRDDLQNLPTLGATTDRYQRFSDAVAVIEEAVAGLGDLDLSWNG